MAVKINYYGLLGVTPTATQDEIKTAYHNMAKANHPDKNPNGVQLMQEINEAYATLNDPDKRDEYDRTEANRREAESESPHKREDAQRKQKEIERFICVVCHEIVKKMFWEASCCGRLCCCFCLSRVVKGVACGKTGVYSCGCPNLACNEQVQVAINFFGLGLLGITSVPQGWAKSSKFIQNQIDAIAPTHCCGRNVASEKLAEHELVCPCLNTMCFKCSGLGETIFGDICAACSGSRILRGKNWSKCFRCDGRGHTNPPFGVVGESAVCPSCSVTDGFGTWGKGALAGHWSRCIECKGKGGINCSCNGFGAISGKLSACFKCQGAGHFAFTRKGKTGWNKCDLCLGSKMLQGWNLIACGDCEGCGCLGCQNKGYKGCVCGDSCRGHTSINI